jgi:phage repressor protein C with HTH and peptisase S24 domain
MVVSRKEKPSFIASNLIHLRQSKEKTLEEMAALLSLKGKSSYSAYEEGRALPDIHKLLKLASYFEVSVENLVYKDIANSKPTKLPQVNKLFEVEMVPIAAAAGYAAGFGDQVWIDRLKKIQVPYKPYGITRAFEISGDSMEPVINHKSIVLGIKIGKGEIKDNSAYIVVTKDGPVCKNVWVNKNDNTIYLLSKNDRYPPRHIDGEEILELWEVWKKDI